MSVRRRIWRGPSGESKEAWVVDYVDQHGERHIKTFTKKHDADAHHAIVGVAVRSGTPYRRQQDRHRRAGRRATAEELRGRRAGTDHDGWLSAAYRPPHRADPGCAQALAIDRPPSARL